MLLKSGQLIFNITRVLAMPRDVFDWHTIGGKKKGKLLLASNREQIDTVLTVPRWMHHLPIKIKESVLDETVAYLS